MFIPLWAMTLVGGILLGAVGMFGLGVWMGERQKTRNARFLAALQDAVEQEQDDVAVQGD